MHDIVITIYIYIYIHKCSSHIKDKTAAPQQEYQRTSWGGKSYIKGERMEDVPRINSYAISWKEMLEVEGKLLDKEVLSYV